MRRTLEKKLWQLILDDCLAHEQPVIWQRPIVRFADAADPGFLRLRDVVTAAHYIPADYLPEAKNVLSWFLPFVQELGRGNLPGVSCSREWADAYNATNAMAARVNEKMAVYIREELGCDAAVPTDAGMIGMDNPRSRWSQRHVAYLAGHGTFGANNMLISDAGSVGRYYSLVTALDMKADPVVQTERCLHKRDGSCGVCIKRCAVGALTEAGFDRFKCLEQCLKNMEQYPGADVCGKCIVELPCSYRDPTNYEE